MAYINGIYSTSDLVSFLCRQSAALSEQGDARGRSTEVMYYLSRTSTCARSGMGSQLGSLIGHTFQEEEEDGEEGEEEGIRGGTCGAFASMIGPK